MTGEDGDAAVKNIIAAIEAKRNIMIGLALEKAKVRIDGDFLRVVLSPDNARDKTLFDKRDKRQAVEEAAREVLGRRLTLSVSVGGQPQVEDSPKRKEAAPSKAQEADNSKVQALADRFQGKVEIIKPEQ